MQATPVAVHANAAIPTDAARTADAAPDSITGLAREGRVRAFDLARGLAVVFMIGVHVLWHWGAPDTWTTPIGQVISFLGGPTAAPVFMFLMGASLAFSSRTSFRSLAVRGLWLLWLGYLLNFLRGVIPAYLGLSAGVVTADQIAPFTLPWLATTVDVHHMAGLSLIALAALRMADPTELDLARRRGRRRDRGTLPPRPGLRDAPARRAAHADPRRGAERVLRRRALDRVPARRRGLRVTRRPFECSAADLPPGCRRRRRADRVPESGCSSSTHRRST